MLLNGQESSHRKGGKAAVETNPIHPRAVGKEGRTTGFPVFYTTIDISARKNKLSQAILKWGNESHTTSLRHHMLKVPQMPKL